MRILPVYLLIFMASSIWAQKELPLITVDSTAYREDHFYIGITYNILLNRPSGITQNNLPYGIQLGYIRDIPVNARRNFGFGVGLGYAVNNYFTNLLAQKGTSGNTYQAISDEVSFKRNKIETHLLEVPLEIRWRTSTHESYKFWRIYGGIKLGYVFANRSKFVGDGGKFNFSNEDIDRFQTDIYISFGYNTWNFYASYGLRRIFKSETVTTSGEPIDMNALKAGLIFYIL
jgi:hypothetical protein